MKIKNVHSNALTLFYKPMRFTINNLAPGATSVQDVPISVFYDEKFQDDLAGGVVQAVVVDSDTSALADLLNAQDPSTVGSTANRPTSVVAGTKYFDTDLAQPIWYDGTQWITADGAGPV